MKEVVLSAKNIRKAFKTPSRLQVLNGIDLEAGRGEAIAIMGKSGEGKSTLLHILGMLEAPCDGSIEICGLTAESASPALIRSRHIGFVFQAFHLFEDATALENVLMPAKIARRATNPQSDSYRRAIVLLEQVGLATRIHFPVKLLSGGEKQRVGIARALANNPNVLLADEPSGNLDQHTSEEIHALLINAVRTHGKTLIVATHDRDLAALCDKTFILKEGKLCAS